MGTGRVVARFSADPRIRQPPYISPDGITGRICVVAEGAKAFGIRDGGFPGTVAAGLYGPDRKPPPSLRSPGYLFPVLLKQELPENARWLCDFNGPIVSAFRDFQLPFDMLARDPRTEYPRKEGLKNLAEKVLVQKGRNA